MKTILLIGSGGFLGSVARYGLQQVMHKIIPSAFPFGTLLVNIIGCFIIGLIYGSMGKSNWLTEDWKLFLAIGICGGFTTFSSFSYENIKLMQEGQTFQALLYIAASVIVGLAMTYIGILISGK